MNAESAAQLLPLYRPGKQTDTRVMKAVRFAEADPNLQPGLQWQIQFDDELVEVIHFIEAPANLRQKLEQMSAAAVDSKSAVRRTVCNPAILSAVCGVLLLVGILVFLRMESAKDFPGKNWAVSMLEMNDRMTGAELEPTRMLAGELSDNFMLRGFDRFSLPVELTKLPAVGWRVFRHSGNKVAQIAMDPEGREGAKGRGVIAFVFRASDFGVHPGSEGVWKVFDHEVWVAAATEHRGLCTLISFRGTPAEMERFLHSIKP